MRYIVLLSGILYVLSCSKDNKPDDCPDHIYEYTAKEQSVIDTTWSLDNLLMQVEQGNKTVLTYKHTSNLCGLASDAGYIEVLALEVPAGTTSFSYTDDELITQGRTFYQMSCYCADVKAHPVVQGTIQGHMTSADTWSIQADVTSPVQNKRISFNKTFKVQ